MVTERHRDHAETVMQWPQPPNHLIDQEEGDSWDAYIWVEDADALFDEFKSKGEDRARYLRPAIRLS